MSKFSGSLQQAPPPLALQLPIIIMCFISYTSTRYKACGTTKPTSKQIVRCRTYHAFKAAVDARQASYSDLPKSCDPRIIPPHNNVVTDNGRCQRDCPYGRSPMYPRCQQYVIFCFCFASRVVCSRAVSLQLSYLMRSALFQKKKLRFWRTPLQSDP